MTNVVNGPKGGYVTTTIAVGYRGSGPGATVQAPVVDSKGRIIEGVTVVGTSGHLYN